MANWIRAHRIAMFSIVTTAAMLAFVLNSAIAGAAGPAKAFDTAYVPKEALAAIVLYPQQVFAAPEFEMLPIEVITAQLMEVAAIDPKQVEQVVVLVSGTTLASPPSAGAIVRFAQDYDQAAVVAHLVPDAAMADVAGTKIYSSNGMTVATPNGRTLLVGAEADVRAMVTAKNVSSPLMERLQKLDTSKPASAIVTLTPLRAEILAALAQVPPLPPPLHQFSDAPKHLAAIQVQLGIGADAGLSLVLEGDDDKAAAAMAKMVEDAIQLGYQLIDAQMAMLKQRQAPAVEIAGMQYARRVAGLLSKQIKRRQEGNRLVVEVEGKDAIQTASTGVLVGLMLPAVQAAREAARRSQASNNLKQIGLAVHNYHSDYNTFPTSTYDKNGKPLLSWRVHILPYVEQQALYDQFHLDEPWDSPHNSKLIEQLPPVYQSPGFDDGNRAGKTVYLAATGDAALFKGAKKLTFSDITDGTSNTIMMVEAVRDRAVIWSKPDDLKVDAANPLAGLTNARPNGFQALFCDGSVRFIANNIDPETMRRLLNPRDGKPVNIQ